MARASNDYAAGGCRPQIRLARACFAVAQVPSEPATASAWRRPTARATWGPPCWCRSSRSPRQWRKVPAPEPPVAPRSAQDRAAGSSTPRGDARLRWSSVGESDTAEWCVVSRFGSVFRLTHQRRMATLTARAAPVELSVNLGQKGRGRIESTKEPGPCNDASNVSVFSVY